MRNDDGAESQYDGLWFHREDGVVLPFKENLQTQNQTALRKTNVTAI